MTATCSVVITNYNYAPFLACAIESALAQTWSATEVVVVDDGSTDGSRAVIESYGERVVPVLKANGGQGSAFNVGLARSVGEIVIFLDADDTLVPHAVETVMPAFVDARVVKVHWPLDVVDAEGQLLGIRIPGEPLPSGDLSRAVIEGGPTSSLSPPTSGNAWCRSFLERIAPVPEAVYRLCADEYLYVLAPILGEVRTIDSTLSRYRRHGANHYASLSGRQKLDLEVASYEAQCAALATTLQRLGIAADVERWKPTSWFHRLASAVEHVHCAVPEAASFVLVDGDTWEHDRLFGDRQVIPATAAIGPPADDTSAQEMLDGWADVDHVVIGWPAFWWLEHFPGFADQLSTRFDLIVDDEDLRILRRRRQQRPEASV